MQATVLDIYDNPENNILTFTINNINVSYANAIRRVTLSNIPIVVFRTSPHEKNDADFIINTSRLNNEILKQRLSCIPIHFIQSAEWSLDEYIMEVDVKNDTDSAIYVTSKDFKIKHLSTDKYLNDDILNKVFPSDPISKQFIDLCKLRPRLSESIPGEQLKMTCLFSIGTAKENGSFNIVSTCAYANTPDIIKIDEQANIIKKELEDKYDDNLEEIQYQFTDWKNLNSKRICIPDSFDFKVETIGVVNNKDIILKAINIIIQRLTGVIELYSRQNNLVIDSDVTIPNCFDIIMENEDYTIGKILEFTLYDNYYIKQKILSYCGFNKPHPHINISIIRLGFNNPLEKNSVVEYLTNAAALAIKYYQELRSELGGTSVDDLLKIPSASPVKVEKIDASEIPLSIPGTGEAIEVAAADDDDDEEDDPPLSNIKITPKSKSKTKTKA